MRNSVIREKYAALTSLAQRVLPSATAINKVSVLLATRFHRAYQAMELARKQIIANHPAPPEWEQVELPPAIADARQRDMDALMAESTPVRMIPDTLRLRLADLPRALKREGGESNVEGVAQIIVMLGTLYVPDAEAISLNAPTEGEEPDDPDESAASAPVDAFAPVE